MSLGLKRKVLQELQNGCPVYSNNRTKQAEILERYKQYLSAVSNFCFIITTEFKYCVTLQYTPEEIEWYGYSFNGACKKLQETIEAQNKIVPLKHVYRSELIEKLKAAKIAEALDEENVGVL